MQRIILPAQSGLFTIQDPRRILSLFGFVFHGPTEEDNRLFFVDMPDGWEKKEDQSESFSRLFDPKGIERAKVFDKHHYPYIQLMSWFTIETRLGIDPETNKTGYQAFVLSADNVELHKTKFHPLTDPHGDDEPADVAAKKDAEGWLGANFPGWDDAGAYWK